MHLTIPLLSALESVWSSIPGTRETSMAEHKLRRAESLTWNPPLLTFKLERHGRTMDGSTRAELQQWTLDLNTASATQHTAGFRQLSPTAPRLKVGPIADRIAQAITDREDYPGLRWKPGKNEVRIQIDDVIVADGFQQTISGRRKRFRKALEELLTPKGWTPVPGRALWTYGTMPRP